MTNPEIPQTDTGVRARDAAPLPRTRAALPYVPPDDGLDLAQLWATLRANARSVLGVAALVACVVLVVTLGSRMTFKSSGRLYLGELEGKGRASGPNDFELAGGDQADLSSEIQILQSESLISRAILDSGLNVSLVPSGWRPPRYLEWRLKRRNLALLDGADHQVIATRTSLTDDSKGPQEYKVKFLSGSEYEVWSEGARLGAGKLDETVQLRGLNLTLQPGTHGTPGPGAEFELRVTPLDEVTREVLKAYRVSVPKAVSPGETGRIVALEYADTSPRLAASFLRELMRGYLDARQSWKSEEATAAEAFITHQLEVMRESLDKTGQRLADYRSKTPMVVLDQEAKAMIEQIGKYEEQRVAARLEVAALSDMKRALKDPNVRMEAFLMGEGDDKVLEELASSLSQARQELASLQQRFQDAAPDVRQQRAHIEAQLGMIRNYLGSRLTRAQENLASLNQIIGQFEDKLKTVPGAELGLAQLARESEVYSRMYSYLLERQQQAAIVKASRVSKNRVLDEPQLPYREYSPQLPLRLAVGLFGLLLGAGWVIARRVLSANFQSEAEVQRMLGAVPIFASVPTRTRSGSRGGQAEGTLFDLALDSMTGAFTEAFRMLRANLYQLGGASGGKVVLVTSPVPGDGKTTSTWALAAMLVADRKRVLVIDADLRKPSHHQLIGQPQEPGLGDALSGEGDWTRLVHAVPLPFGEVYALSAGSAVPAEFLSSERLGRLLADARSRCDFIVLDAASFPLVSDALTLADHADCVLSVMRLRNTPRKLAAEHVRRISAFSPSYGVVINDVGPAEPYGQRRPPKLVRPVRSSPPSRDFAPVAPVARRRVRWWLGGTTACLLVATFVLTQSRRADAWNLPRFVREGASMAMGPRKAPARATAPTELTPELPRQVEPITLVPLAPAAPEPEAMAVATGEPEPVRHEAPAAGNAAARPRRRASEAEAPRGEDAVQRDEREPVQASPAQPGSHLPINPYE